MSLIHSPRCSLFPERNLFVFDGIPYDAPGLQSLRRDYTDGDIQHIAENAHIYFDDGAWGMACSAWYSGTQRHGVGIPIKRIGSIAKL